MKDYDVIVIGGGMVGLAFVLELSQKNTVLLQLLSLAIVILVLTRTFIPE